MHDLLVDVVTLSRERCVYPIAGLLAYATTDNFMGRIVDGYHTHSKSIFLLAKQAAGALCDVQNELSSHHFSLFIHDAYRPLRATRQFLKWFNEPETSDIAIARKKIHYPNINKKTVRELYFPVAESSHNFGCAIDVTLMDQRTKQLVDMGTHFDFFDASSSIYAKTINQAALYHRQILIDTMRRHHFFVDEREFWHFDYAILEIDQPMDFLL